MEGSDRTLGPIYILYALCRKSARFCGVELPFCACILYVSSDAILTEAPLMNCGFPHNAGNLSVSDLTLRIKPIHWRTSGPIFARARKKSHPAGTGWHVPESPRDHGESRMESDFESISASCAVNCPLASTSPPWPCRFRCGACAVFFLKGASLWPVRHATTPCG